MKKPRKQYTREFKMEAVRLPKTSGKSAPKLERELGLGKGNLWRWRKKSAADGEDAFPGHGRLRPEQEEIRRLKRELEITRQQRGIQQRQWPSSRSQANEISVQRSPGRVSGDLHVPGAGGVAEWLLRLATSASRCARDGQPGIVQKDRGRV